MSDRAVIAVFLVAYFVALPGTLFLLPTRWRPRAVETETDSDEILP